MKQSIVKFLRDEEGAAGVEYGLLAAMVAVILALFTGPISAAVQTIFDNIQTGLTP